VTKYCLVYIISICVWTEEVRMGLFEVFLNIEDVMGVLIIEKGNKK
jgi:hypothetical protein